MIKLSQLIWFIIKYISAYDLAGFEILYHINFHIPSLPTYIICQNINLDKNNI